MIEAHAQWLRPQWPVAANVRALITTRAGGYSTGPWGAGEQGGLNLGLGSGDAPDVVARNRERLRASLPAPPCWLQQVHGTHIVDAAQPAAGGEPQADAALSAQPGVICAVLVADCLPVLLADARGRAVAAVHAGWRGLAAGIVQQSVAALRAHLADPAARLLAYLGPAIGPCHFEVGPEVLVAMRQRLPQADAAFTARSNGKFHADLFALAGQALQSCGVTDIHGGGVCTFDDPHRFYSFRRDTPTGRQAALIWLDAHA